MEEPVRCAFAAVDNTGYGPRARLKVWVGGNIFLVTGQRQPYIRNGHHEAARAARLLSAVAALPIEARRRS